MNQLTQDSPEKISHLTSLVSNYTKKLKENKLEDENIYNGGINKKESFADLFIFLVGFPFYLLGKLMNLVPWSIAKAVAKKTAKNIEFYLSVLYVSSIFLSIFYLIAELIAIWCIFGIWWYLPLYFTIKLTVCSFAVKYSPFGKEVRGNFRLKRIKKNFPSLYNELQLQRKEILSNLTVK